MTATAPERERVTSDVTPMWHLADRRRNHEFSLCGIPRRRPLDASLWNHPEDLCVVCMDIYRGRRTES